MSNLQFAICNLRTFLVAAVWMVLLAGLLSLSRGGMIAIALAAAVATAVGCWTSSLGRKFASACLPPPSSWAVRSVFSATIAFRADWKGWLPVSLEQLDQGRGRRDLWMSLLKAIPQYAVFGSGAGSHGEVHQIYFNTPLDQPIEYTHAENGYLQVALETGLPGLLLLSCGIGLCAFWCVGGMKRAASNRVRFCQGAIAAGLAASAGHALVDFAWYMPGCMVVVALLAASASASISCRP